MPYPRDVGTRDTQLYVPSRTQYILCFAGSTTNELRVLVSLLHTHCSSKVIRLIWFAMICRIAYRVVTGHGASDNRSEEEDG